MQNFKNFLLKEENNYFWPKEDIFDWATDQGGRVLKKYDVQSPHANGTVKDPIITNDGKLNCKQFAVSSFPECFPLHDNTNFRKFPCQFGHISESFFAGDCDLYSLKGAPISVARKFSVSNNKNITSLDYLPENAGKYILRGTSITSFHGINKIVKQINKTNDDFDNFVLPFSTKECLLGFFLIAGCNDIGYSSTAPDSELQRYSECIKAINIVGRHLREQGDMLECQEELITNGLNNYAKL